jgi:hypothetical protein
MNIYRLKDELREPTRWFLSVPTSSDSRDLTWSFNTARRFEQITPLFTKLDQDGRKVDFTFGAFDVPILNFAAMSVFQTYERECVEFIPTIVEGERDAYFIMNILAEADCLDESASLITWWAPGDGRPDRIGTYRMLAREVYDCSITKLPAIFRLSKFSVMIMVRDDLRKAIDDAGLTGLFCDELIRNDAA